MGKIVWLFLFGTLIVICSGCGHNAIQYSDGIGFETVIRPDTGNFGLTFRYGKILSVAARENTEVEMTGEGSGGGNGGNNNVSASSSGGVKIKIGRQITGYYVDALNTGATPEQLNAYICDYNGDTAAKETKGSNDTQSDTNAVKTPENVKKE